MYLFTYIVGVPSCGHFGFKSASCILRVELAHLRANHGGIPKAESPSCKATKLNCMCSSVSLLCVLPRGWGAPQSNAHAACPRGRGAPALSLSLLSSSASSFFVSASSFSSSCSCFSLFFWILLLLLPLLLPLPLSLSLLRKYFILSMTPQSC